MVTMLKQYWFRLPESLRRPIIYFLLTRTLFTILGAASVMLIGRYSDATRQLVPGFNPGYSGNPLLDLWARWDSGWYLHIAESGYTSNVFSSGQTDIAYFPLYPYLIRILSWPFGYNKTAVIVTGILISSVAFIAAAYFLYRLVAKRFNDQIARLSVLLLFLSPMSFIFSAVMTESLFLLLIVLTFWLAEEKRWAWVGAVASLLPLVRPVGPFIVAFLGLMYLNQLKWSWRKLISFQSLWLIGPIIGGLTLLLINYMVTGNPLGFVEAQAAWQRTFLNFSGPSGGLFTLQGLYLALFAVASIVLVTIYRRQIGNLYWLMAVILVLLPLSSSLYGLIRYTAIIFPVYICFALLLDRHKSLYEPAIMAFMLLQGVHFVWWALGMPIMQ